MKIKTKIRQKIIDLTGYYVYKQKDMPIGNDLISDIKTKLRIPINIIFDVGANVGQTTMKFKNSFNNASIFSFEPITETYNELVTKTRTIEKVYCQKLALGEKKEVIEIEVFKKDDSVLNSLKKAAQCKGGKTQLVHVTTGDMFCNDNDIDNIDFLKIDTEGYEIEVLNGFNNMIKNNKIKAIYCECGFSPNNERNTFINNLITFAYKNGFRFYGLYEVSFTSNYGNILFVNDNIYDNSNKTNI